MPQLQEREENIVITTPKGKLEVKICQLGGNFKTNFLPMINRKGEIVGPNGDALIELFAELAMQQPNTIDGKGVKINRHVPDASGKIWNVSGSWCNPGWFIAANPPQKS